MLRLTALCETGTRALRGAAFGPTDRGEAGYAVRLLPLISKDMLLPADRGFDSDDFLTRVADTGAQLLIRLDGRRTPAVMATVPDGSFLTRINSLTLRVVEADITMTCDDEQHITNRWSQGGGDCVRVRVRVFCHASTGSGGGGRTLRGPGPLMGAAPWKSADRVGCRFCSPGFSPGVC
ncbi:hypothetical protein [Streptomyces sp. NPDC058572]|uniref:hypothetical protein n=1 Tax=Streptomyces sp. NPDC058572 TaxID=3346546 RepID=UPI003654DE37